MQCSFGSSQHFWTRACAEDNIAKPYEHNFTNLSALLLWYLLALLNWDICTFLGGHLPASGLGHLKNYCDGFREGRSRETVTYIGADFLRSRAAALLWNLLASLVRNLVALSVGHLCRIDYVNHTKTMDWKRQTTDLGANVLGELVAIGAGLLPGKEGSIKHL